MSRGVGLLRIRCGLGNLTGMKEQAQRLGLEFLSYRLMDNPCPDGSRDSKSQDALQTHNRIGIMSPDF